jgi:hypothetical protein
MHSSSTVELNAFGHGVKATGNKVDRFRNWCFHARRSLRVVALAGAGVAVAASGTLAAVGLVAAVGAATASLTKKPHDPVPDKVEAYVADMLGVSDSVRFDGKLAEEHLDEVDRGLTQSAVKWVHELKMHFGELKDTSADRIVAKRWLAEQMKAADMRTKDAVALIPTVVELMFLPTLDELLAVMVRRSRVGGLMKALCPRSAA